MDDQPELPALLPETTYLREVAIEGQELYMELRYAGFTDRQAINIVAQMVIDAVSSRDDDEYEVEFISSYEDDDDEDDDLYDDRDSG